MFLLIVELVEFDNRPNSMANPNQRQQFTLIYVVDVIPISNYVCFLLLDCLLCLMLLFL
jgi:hypothetical protein